jgi:hypothetical protein
MIQKQLDDAFTSADEKYLNAKSLINKEKDEKLAKIMKIKSAVAEEEEGFERVFQHFSSSSKKHFNKLETKIK